ncbi:DUF4221 family protein [Negadavirga shengliensis]|uniref:DUF4221 family protein n=1 Tax=Negadavirga shengliensis TaxID=1389218 RepID=A0ABV9T6Z2_9BACT
MIRTPGCEILPLFLNKLPVLFYVLPVLCLFSFAGCRSNESASVSSGNLQLINAEKNLALGIDEETPNFSYAGIRYFRGEKPWLFSLNEGKNEIQMFDLQEQKLHKRLQFEVEGDKGVGHVFGFHVHNLDSIFIFPQFKGEIFITDTSKSIKNKHTYSVPDFHTPAFVLPDSPPVLQSGQRLVVRTRPEGNYNELKDEELSTRHLAYTINLNNGESGLLPHFYPKGYLAQGPRIFEFSMAASPQKTVYSFFADHRLYYSTSDTGELEEVYARSKYLPDDFANRPLSGTPLENMQYTFGSNRYSGIMYDPYREVFYRFCYPEVEIRDREEGMQLRGFPKKFSIMVLDKDLNILGETLFDKPHYVPHNAFVAEEGLYISINHPENPDNQEDYFAFALLVLEEGE